MRTALLLIGFTIFIMLLVELTSQQIAFNPIRFAFNLLALASYLLMWYNDSIKNRERFFYAFTYYVIALIVVGFTVTYFKIADGKIV